MSALREKLAQEARDNAERVRVALRELYPEVKFRVVGHRRNNWRVTVSWTDGPGVLELIDAAEHASGVQVSTMRRVSADLLAWVVWNDKDEPTFMSAPKGDKVTPEFEVFRTLARDLLGKNSVYSPDRIGIYHGMYWAQDRLRGFLGEMGGRRGCELLAQ